MWVGGRRGAWQAGEWLVRVFALGCTTSVSAWSPSLANVMHALVTGQPRHSNLPSPTPPLANNRLLVRVVAQGCTINVSAWSLSLANVTHTLGVGQPGHNNSPSLALPPAQNSGCWWTYRVHCGRAALQVLRLGLRGCLASCNSHLLLHVWVSGWEKDTW